MTGTAKPLVALRGVGKRYGAVDVLRDVSLDIAAGECLGVVGENGAGKSTLLNIISGKTSATSGSLLIDGEPRSFRTHREARAVGIEIIPQELAYVPYLTVAENLMLGNWPRGRWTTSQRWMNRASQSALDRLGLSIDVRRRVVDLTLAERQLVEIAKALMGAARLLILDEPTASLHAKRTEFLLGKLHALKAAGTSLIYVSHHLTETLDISDSIAVLRNGDLADVSPTRETDLNRTVSLMLGAESAFDLSKEAPKPGGEAIRLRGWASDIQPALSGCDLDIRPGEVLGIFGLIGSGAEAIARGLGGRHPSLRGTLEVSGRIRRIPRSPRRAREIGIAYVPAERKTDGLALNQSVVDNLTVMVLGRYTGFASWLRAKTREADARQQMTAFDVRARSTRQEVGELSGGNQQKVLIAGRLMADPELLVLHEPTRGVDIGSRNQIHAQLAHYSRQGRAVVIVTSDVDEAVDAADRLLVMRDGGIVDELVGSRKTKNLALSIAAGSTDDPAA